MTTIITFLVTALIVFVLCFILVPLFMGLLRMFGLYTIVNEGTCQVYVLFGKVIGVLSEPGLYFLPAHLGLNAFLVRWLGRHQVLDMRLDQRYLRSQAVNSEEGAPMGVGIWYEMFISDPVSYMFKNADPQGSLAANVSNAAVRSLSNMPLAAMLEDRHSMSQAVRHEVSPKSTEWGYQLGSVYVRKVHFRDEGMIRQIEAKVVNRLRQVTSAIKQDGANQVSIISSTAERRAAVEFAKAEAMRPQIVGAALNEISQDPEIATSLFELLEMQNLLDSKAAITLVPPRNELLTQMLASDAPPAPTNGTPAPRSR
ncbi:MAG TPA: SPFH domain-containing protein [Roseiflexaceae bacterium]|nr:SPFH domain-containing protein [Roseiflexaceae bacterium]